MRDYGCRVPAWSSCCKDIGRDVASDRKAMRARFPSESSHWAITSLPIGVNSDREPHVLPFCMMNTEAGAKKLSCGYSRPGRPKLCVDLVLGAAEGASEVGLKG